MYKSKNYYARTVPKSLLYVMCGYVRDNTINNFIVQSLYLFENVYTEQLETKIKKSLHHTTIFNIIFILCTQIFQL